MPSGRSNTGHPRPSHAIGSLSGLALWVSQPTSSLAAWDSPQPFSTLHCDTLHCGHQLDEADDVEHPPEIEGERRQTELATNLLQATRQERTLVHPLFDRAEWMLHRLPTLVEGLGTFRQTGLHPVQDGFVLQARDRAEAIFCASRT